MTKVSAKRARKVVATVDATLTATDVTATVEQVAIDTGAVAAIDANDVLAVLNDATANDDATLSLRDLALSFDTDAVDAMVSDIRATFDARDAFEQSRGLSLADKSSSYAKAKANMLNNAIAVARGFLALNVEPVNVIRRKVVSGNEFSAKALDKVTELCAFICGNAARFQSVTKAFIACAIAVADKSADDSAIGNKVNKLFLSNASFDRLVNDAELAAYIADYQHKFMSGGKDTQSSQVRNVLDVLGLATICTVDHARGGITINKAHGFYSLFRERYMTQAQAVVTA